MFKVGQKVVFKFDTTKARNPDCIVPSDDSIVTIKSYVSHIDGWELFGYERCKMNRRQCFFSSHLRPIDFSFGEKLAEEIQEEINQEQLVNA